MSQKQYIMSDIIQRRKPREVSVGDVKIGGDSPITVQSMLNTKTIDVEGSIKQIEELRSQAMWPMP